MYVTCYYLLFAVQESSEVKWMITIKYHAYAVTNFIKHNYIFLKYIFIS